MGENGHKMMLYCQMCHHLMVIPHRARIGAFRAAPDMFIGGMRVKRTAVQWERYNLAAAEGGQLKT